MTKLLHLLEKKGLALEGGLLDVQECRGVVAVLDEQGGHVVKED